MRGRGLGGPDHPASDLEPLFSSSVQGLTARSLTSAGSTGCRVWTRHESNEGLAPVMGSDIVVRLRQKFTREAVVTRMRATAETMKGRLQGHCDLKYAGIDSNVELQPAPPLDHPS